MARPVRRPAVMSSAGLLRDSVVLSYALRCWTIATAPGQRADREGSGETMQWGQALAPSLDYGAGCRKILVFPGGRALQLAAPLSLGAASMSRFRCCLLVLASALWGAAA